MYPHERSLVKRFADSPFVIVGVNSDRSRKRVERLYEDETVTWPSFWNGGGLDGPISARWQVGGWPSLFLIDSKGIIRAKGLRGRVLDNAIIDLLKEMGEEIPPEVAEENPAPAGDPSNENEDQDQSD